MVKADPLPLHQMILDVGPELDVDLRLSTSAHKDAPLGHQNVLKTVRRVFEVRPYEEGGLTETETVALLNHFLGYVGFVRRKYANLVEDCDGNLADFVSLLGRKPAYEEYVAFRLNRQSALFAKAGPVFFGVMAALGGLDPGKAFWRAICGSDGQATALKGQLDAARHS